MRKFWIILLCSFSLVISAQDWKFENNPFNQPYRNPYETSSTKAQQEINRDMNNVKKIIRSSTKIYEHFKNNEVGDHNNIQENEETSNSSPGAPREPVPIDDNLILLMLSALALIFVCNKNKILI